MTEPNIELEGAGAKLKLRNVSPRVLVDVMMTVVLAVIAVFSWDHRAELQSIRLSDNAGRAEMVAAIKDLAASQRFLGCILAASQDTRDKVECSNQLRGAK